MSETSTEFFVAGGTIPGGGRSYVKRAADDELFGALKRGEFCYVLTSRQMGKSSLMVRTAGRLSEAGVAVAIVDLTRVGTNLTVSQWYNSILVLVAEQLGLDDELDDFREQHKDFSPLQLWRAAMREIVLKWKREPIVVFIDEIDITRSIPFSTDELFAGIRELYNARTQDPELSRLTFCLLGVARPSDLIKDERMTPFNVGKPIRLTDFTEAEAAPLAAGLQAVMDGGEIPAIQPGHACVSARRLLSRVLHWTGGHPFLTQRLCEAVAAEIEVHRSPLLARTERAGEGTGVRFRENELVDRVCAKMFFNADSAHVDDNLAFVRTRLLGSQDSDVAGALTFYSQVLRGRPVSADDANLNVSLLLLAGVVRRERGLLRPRNRIYAQVFDRKWVEDHLPEQEVRRQRAAFVAGIVRVLVPAVVVIAIVTALSLSAIVAERHARAAEAQMKRVLYAADTALAQQNYNDGNLQAIVRRLDEHVNDSHGFEWGYLQHLSHSDLRTMSGHELVFHVAYSPDGSLIASADLDKSIRLWNAKSDAPAISLLGHTDLVHWVAFSSDGRMIASASKDGTVRLWDVTTRRQVRQFDTKVRDGDRATCVEFSPSDPRVIAAGDSDGTLWVWDISGRLLHRFPGRSYTDLSGFRSHGGIYGVAFSKDGRRLVASGGYAPKPGVEGLIRQWDTSTWNSSESVEPVTLFSPVFAPDGRTLAVTRTDGKVGIWDATTGRRTKVISGFNDKADGIAFSHDGKHLAAAGWDGTVRTWDWPVNRPPTVIRGHTSRVTSVAFSPDDRILASGGGRDVKLWSLAELTREPIVHLSEQVHAIALTKSGDTMAIEDGHQGSLWNTRLRRRTIPAWSSENPLDGGAAISPNGKLIADSVYGKASLYLRDASTGALYKELKSTSDGTGYLLQCAFSPDGRCVAASWSNRNTKRRIYVWDVESGGHVQNMEGHTVPNGPLSFSSDSDKLVSGSDPDDIQVCNVGSGKLLGTLARKHQNIIEAIAWSPDGKMIATASWDTTIWLWDASTLKPIAQLLGHNGSVNTCAFSPDSRYLVSGSDDKLVKYWDVALAREILTLRGHTKRVTAVAFSRDGKLLVSGSYDGTVRLWRAGPVENVEKP